MTQKFNEIRNEIKAREKGGADGDDLAVNRSSGFLPSPNASSGFKSYVR